MAAGMGLAPPARGRRIGRITQGYGIGIGFDGRGAKGVTRFYLPSSFALRLESFSR